MKTGTEIMMKHGQTIGEIIDEEKRQARYEAIGWAHTFCCLMLDQGRDPRQVDCAAMLEQAKCDLEPNEQK